GHRTTCPLGVEGNDLPPPTMPLLERRLDERRMPARAIDAAVVLLRSVVDEDPGTRVGHRTAKGDRDAGAPEPVQVRATLAWQPRTHLEAIGLDQVERAQHAVQARRSEEH